MDTEHTLEEVRKHFRRTDCWIVIDGGVYNVTSFVSFHPGGSTALVRNGGTDASTKFRQAHSDDAYDSLKLYKIGRLKGAPAAVPAAPTAPAPPTAAAVPTAAPTTAAVAPTAAPTTAAVAPTSVPAAAAAAPAAVTPRPAMTPSSPAVPALLSVPKDTFKAPLISVTKSSTHSKLFVVSNPDPTVFSDTSFPIFGHVRVFRPTQSGGVARSYTPTNISRETITFLIKRYDGGTLSAFLCDTLRTPGTDVMHLSAPVPPSTAEELPKPLRVRVPNVGFVAAGTGLSPFLPVLTSFLNKSTTSAFYPKLAEVITLVNCQRDAEDGVGAEVVETLTRKSNRVVVHTHCSATSSGGRIDAEALVRYGAGFWSQVVICGPVAFNQAVKGMCMRLGYLEQSVTCLE
eukprot:PhM_4_TR5623/c0_g1_i1/m.62023